MSDSRAMLECVFLPAFIDKLKSRQQIRTLIQGMSRKDVMKQYFNVDYDSYNRVYIWPDGSRESEVEIVFKWREYIEDAIEWETGYEN